MAFDLNIKSIFIKYHMPHEDIFRSLKLTLNIDKYRDIDATEETLHYRYSIGERISDRWCEQAQFDELQEALEAFDMWQKAISETFKDYHIEIKEVVG